jgi:hypothetical protein
MSPLRVKKKTAVYCKNASIPVKMLSDRLVALLQLAPRHSLKLCSLLPEDDPDHL